MEIVIVICLLVIIVLLLQDKVVIIKNPDKKPTQEKPKPDIMGQPKPVRSFLMPDTVNESQIEKPEIDPDSLDIEYNKNEQIAIQVPQEELDEVFSNMPDFEEEEEEWNSYREPNSDNGFAQGVTFEELSSVGMLLQQKELKLTQQMGSIETVQKIEGTELFSLLENSIGSASQKIAELLDKRFPTEVDSGSSILSENELEDFDIGEFV